MKFKFLILLTFSGLFAFAQESKLNVEYDFLYSNPKQINDGDVKFFTHDFNIVFNKDFAQNLSTALSYKYKNSTYDYSDISSKYYLYSNLLSLNIKKSFDKIGFELNPFLKFNSGEQNIIAKRYLQYGLNADFGYSFSNKFKLILGVQYHYFGLDESKYFLFPIIGFNWNLTEKLGFNVFFPLNADVKYKFSDKIAIGLEYLFDFNFYNYPDSYSNYQTQFSFNYSFLAEYSPIKSLSFYTKFGLISNDFHYHESYFYSTAPFLNSSSNYMEMEDSFYFQIGFRYRLFD